MSSEEVKTATLRIIYCILLLWSIAGLIRCTVHEIKPDPNPEPESACEGLCSVLEENHCPGYRGSPGVDEQFETADDVGCREQCEKSVVLAPWMLDKAACGSVATDCEGVDKCMEKNP